jgi:hypothetical protein
MYGLACIIGPNQQLFPRSNPQHLHLFCSAGHACAGSNNSSSSSSVMPGWRDLSISQYRRIKGDAQLSQTYAMSAAAAAAAAGLAPGERYNTCYNSHNSRHPWAWPGGWGDAASPSAVAAAAGDFSGSGDAAAAAAAAAAAIVPPHHISNEPMSELSYAIYMARRLPVELLVSLVRRSFRPAEYPASIEVLYHSSPDEALPQFYTDPKVGELL